MEINVRQAGLSDIKKLVEKIANEKRILRGRAKRKSITDLLQRLKAGHWCFIAEKTDEILGYAWIAFRELYISEIEKKMALKEDEAMFYDVYTFSLYRNKGVAKKIYEVAINYLRKNDYKKIYVAILQHNRPSRKVAEKFNFKAVETITFLKIFCIKNLARTHVMSKTLDDLSDEKRAAEDKRKEMSIRNKEAQIYDLQYSRYRKNVEIEVTLANFEIEKSDLVLDAGAGTGRFTVEFAKKGAEIVAIDYSLESLKINRARSNCHVIVADICYLPFRSSVFDKTASIGVFQHIPTWKSRFDGLEEILRVSKKGGEFLVSVYNHNLRTGGLDKQGYHSRGSIYYYCFHFTEFKNMLVQVFPKILDLRGILIFSFLMDGFYKKGLERLVLIFEYLIEKTFLSLLLGSRLVAMCET